MAAKQLGSMAVGSIVKLNVGGVPTNFIVVNQGKPSSLYDDSCNGTWLLMENIYQNAQWNSSNVNDYAGSTINSYLNNTFFGLLDPGIQAVVPQVKIPYRPGSGTGSTINSGANGLPVKIFLLSGREVGWTTSDYSYLPDDGAKLAYFLSGTGSAANAKRVAKLNGGAAVWRLRSPYLYDSDSAWHVSSDGYGNYSRCTGSCGVRPALILSSTLFVSDDGTITVNQPPEAPASITVPENIQGGSSISISWAAATDLDGNLEGYILERSTDGGSGWSQIYQGAATSTTNTVAFGTVSVIYRVKAYDAAGAESGWRTSAQVTVTNNQAPAAPGSITVPNLVKGGESLAVSWAAASDPDGNLTGYELERKTDAADWAQVYKGEGLSFTDQITKGWQSVQYRVRALDSYNAASGWTESETRTVDNNSAPVITCDYPSGSDLGEKAEPFAVNYTVTDPDGDPLTITETLDSEATRSETEVESGAALTAATLNDPAEFQKILNGTHSLKISASDGKAIAAHNLTFTKKVTSASVTLKEPMAVEGDISLAVLRVAGSIPADALFTVEVTNNGNDDEPVWQDATDEVKRGANIVFENHTAAKGAAFNFRLSVSRGPSGEGGYLTSISGAFQ